MTNLLDTTNPHGVRLGDADWLVGEASLTLDDTPGTGGADLDACDYDAQLRTVWDRLSTETQTRLATAWATDCESDD